jgi:signal transduction histidine kinase
MGLLAERLVERLAADPRAEGVRLAAVVAGPCVVLAVAERLETVLMNLLDNALRFAPEGVGPPQVTVTVAERAGRVEVRVEDSGPGVPIADRERVFQRFFSRRPGGTGLGLALCQAIVEAHGGEIALEPGPAGCGFFFWLPTIDSQPR